MAQYLIVTSDDPSLGLMVEAKNIQQAIEGLDLESGEKCVVYRLAAPPRYVTVREEVVRKVDIE